MSYLLTPSLIQISAYAAANADTWASEIGSLSTGANLLITTFKPVNFAYIT